MMTKLIIYLLAMMTGFSAAEAACPASATPTSVGAAVGQTYAAVAVNVATQKQGRELSNIPISAAPVWRVSVVPAFLTVGPTTPVLRHDVILG
jgi:hypothetical protein